MSDRRPIVATTCLCRHAPAKTIQGMADFAAGSNGRQFAAGPFAAAWQGEPGQMHPTLEAEKSAAPARHQQCFVLFVVHGLTGHLHIGHSLSIASQPAWLSMATWPAEAGQICSRNRKGRANPAGRPNGCNQFPASLRSLDFRIFRV
jgi:hypothetical protein